MHHDLVIIGRCAVGFVLAYAIGFEREARGAAAGDRTFAIIGLAASAITATVTTQAPTAIAGVVTGVGFIGGGLLFRPDQSHVKGVTTASTIFACAALGVTAGEGRLLVALAVTVLVLLALELRHIPGLRVCDASRYVDRVKTENVPGSQG